MSVAPVTQPVRHATDPGAHSDAKKATLRTAGRVSRSQVRLGSGRITEPKRMAVDVFGSGVVLRIRGVVVVRGGPPMAGVIYRARVRPHLDREEHEDHESKGHKHERIHALDGIPCA